MNLKILTFLQTISRRTKDGFIMENDDAVSTLNDLIDEARELLKELEK